MDAIQLAKYMQNHVFQIGTTGFKSFLPPYYVPPYVVKFFSIHYIVSGKSMYKPGTIRSRFMHLMRLNLACLGSAR